MTSRMRVRIAVLAAAVLLAALVTFLLVSRLDPAVNTGPLGNGGTAGGICSPIAPGQVDSWGITYLGNTGSSDAVIEKIALVKPRNLRLVASYVVPITGYREYGDNFGYPRLRISRESTGRGTRSQPGRTSRQLTARITLTW